MAGAGDLSSNRFRHETKLPLQRQQYQELRPAFIGMALHPRRTYADRRVCSIYLDTPEFDDYCDGVSGLSRRSKTRFRWYQEDTAHMVLEVKRKKNKISAKFLFQMKNPSGLIPPISRLIGFDTRPNYRSSVSSIKNSDQLSSEWGYILEKRTRTGESVRSISIHRNLMTIAMVSRA